VDWSDLGDEHAGSWREGVDWSDLGDGHAGSWSDRNLFTISKTFQMLEKDSASYS
jgi:hypothetical protein